MTRSSYYVLTYLTRSHLLPMTNKYSVARDHIVPDNEHAFETSLKMSTVKNMVWSGWPMPDNFVSSDIHWLVPQKTQKTTKGYLFAYNNVANSSQMLFFEITLTNKSKRKKGPWPTFTPFKKSEIDWNDDVTTHNTQSEKLGLLSQHGTPSRSFSVVLKSVAYGPSNYTQLNESMKLVYAKEAPV